jgi:hypothetical protein
MPDHRLQNTRDVYPPGGPMWRRPSDNAAEQLRRAVERAWQRGQMEAAWQAVKTKTWGRIW